ncbi:hypothetical protein BDD12DRAFT_104669 [Trichophaea hybrida]|nr:hypothetical protein BDD12DRAFT_104669 [Trichophaea hybrida]
MFFLRMIPRGLVTMVSEKGECGVCGMWWSLCFLQGASSNSCLFLRGAFTYCSTYETSIYAYVSMLVFLREGREGGGKSCICMYNYLSTYCLCEELENHRIV